MYMVKNISGGALPISLEKGSTILAPNKTLDLDGLCSRKFIREDKALKHLLNPNLNALGLVHDSEQGVPSQITKDIRPGLPGGKPPKSKKREKVVIMDFSDIGEPQQEEPVVEDLSGPEEVKNVKKEKPAVEVKKEVRSDGKISCTICGKFYKGERGLKTHMRKKHKED